MWILFMIVVHVNDPRDIPGKIVLEFKSEKQCQEVLSSISYWTKFSWFKVEGNCYDSTKIDQNMLKGMIRPSK